MELGNDSEIESIFINVFILRYLLLLLMEKLIKKQNGQ